MSELYYIINIIDVFGEYDHMGMKMLGMKNLGMKKPGDEKPGMKVKR